MDERGRDLTGKKNKRGELQDEGGSESEMSHLLTTSAPNHHRQSTLRSTPPTCSPPKNISIVITPCHPSLPPLPLPPTHHPNSANHRLANTNRCLPHRLPSTNTFRPLVTPSMRTQSGRGFTHGAMATQTPRDRRES